MEFRHDYAAARLDARPAANPESRGRCRILFSVLLLAVFWFMRRSVPRDPLEPGAWLRGGTTNVAFALNLVPFAGVAFLWFVGVLRDRLGAREDRFFATVFLGSALLLLAMLFTAAAATGAIILAFHAAPEMLINSATFHFARGLAYGMVNIYLVKTASVFMITTSTIALYTRLTPRWLAVGGYAVAIVLLIGSYYLDWSLIVFPFWVCLVSLSILLDRGANQDIVEQGK